MTNSKNSKNSVVRSLNEGGALPHPLNIFFVRFGMYLHLRDLSCGLSHLNSLDLFIAGTNVIRHSSYREDTIRKGKDYLTRVIYSRFNALARLVGIPILVRPVLHGFDMKLYAYSGSGIIIPSATMGDLELFAIDDGSSTYVYLIVADRPSVGECYEIDRCYRVLTHTQWGSSNWDGPDHHRPFHYSSRSISYVTKRPEETINFDPIKHQLT